MQHVAAYERLAARAALSGEETDVKKALLAHPLIGQYRPAEELLKRMARLWSLTLALAVDGGNSKTDLALVRSDGGVLAVVRGPQSSPHHLGSRGLARRARGLLEEACRRADRRGLRPWRTSGSSSSPAWTSRRRRPSFERRSSGGLGGEGDRRQRHVRRPAGRHRAWLGGRRGVRRRDQLRRRCAGRSAGRFPALGAISGTGAAATTSVWPRSRRRHAARTAVARRRPWSAPSQPTSACRRRSSWLRPSIDGRFRCAVCRARAACLHRRRRCGPVCDRGAARVRDRGARPRRPDTSRPDWERGRRFCLAAGCSSPPATGSWRRSRLAYARSDRRSRPTGRAPRPSSGRLCLRLTSSEPAQRRKVDCAPSSATRPGVSPRVSRSS